ncbi:phage baseplate assembly protein V [Microbacterium rhizosphaerae]|uniref:Phage baseplate assembly protein V n=1 Tax=Microbacterium rhizosphaerae TaxID=1678237 RepID=A0ABZ0SNR4_9MICO|nr:phage baseplate assembly protein V [Microbacterium rhizosphaerae]WPR88921.1 phage baseplate assembly protein V [Microbacterium rhizosphaerae]
MSIHRGVVINNIDPQQRGRLQITVYDVFGADVSPWALPVIPLGSATPITPPIGAEVWVTFENDDVNYPVVLGLVPTMPMVTPVQLAAELGHDDGDRPGRRVRRYLRERYPGHQHHGRWLLTPEQANDVRAHFQP